MARRGTPLLGLLVAAAVTWGDAGLAAQPAVRAIVGATADRRQRRRAGR